MITVVIILACTILYLVLGAFVMSGFWQYLCEHEESNKCKEYCWCGRPYGYTVKLISYTGILTWLPLMVLGVPFVIYEIFHED
jgi:hypothetical protein